MNDALTEAVVKTTSTAFGGFIDPARQLVDLPSFSLVEVDIPEYARSGLGRALLRVVRYYFEDIGAYGVEGMSIGARSSRAHVIYADMNPELIGYSHKSVHELLPFELITKLLQRGYSRELISLAAVRHKSLPGIEELSSFLELYEQRASWIERHPLQVAVSNLDALRGVGGAFDWRELLPAQNERGARA